MIKHKKETILATAVLLTAALVMGGTVFASEKNISKQEAARTAIEATKSTQSTTGAAKEFTTEELAKYNGKNGQPAYIAVDGIVYNAEGWFANGTHHGYSAGQDLTTAFYSEHSKSRLAGLEIVGILKGSGAVVPSATAAGAATAITAEEKTALTKKLNEIKQKEIDLDLREDALEADYSAGKITLEEYRMQDQKLEAEEDQLDLEEDKIEEQLYKQEAYDDHDNDYDDHHDDDDHLDRDFD